MSECEKCGEPLDANGLCPTDRETLASSRATIWVMDSDICDECGGLMGDWGFCLDCGYDGIDWDEEADEDWWWYPDEEVL